MSEPLITIITPTIGVGLKNLIYSLENQSVNWVHILLWDNKREGDFLYPDPKTLKVRSPYIYNGDTSSGSRYSLVINGFMVNGVAAGSSLRAIGLMAANTEFVTFADSDVWYEKNHLSKLIKSIGDKNWGYCRRKIWKNSNEFIGVDNFESVGNHPDRKVQYEMVDNNCMIFRRRFGTSGAVLYRETKEYNDDRLFYAFLKEHAGEPYQTKEATVNQICPLKLIQMFDNNCTK